VKVDRTVPAIPAFLAAMAAEPVLQHGPGWAYERRAETLAPVAS
jgi:hypothetical protein